MRRMFYLKISDVNKDTTLELNYDGFRNFIGDKNTFDKYNWTIKDLKTDSDTTSWQQFIDKHLHELQCFCRKLLHKDVETRKSMLSDEHMRLFGNHFSKRIAEMNYDTDRIVPYFSNMGAALCEYRPNQLAGYSFYGTKATIQFTDENINLITYEVNKQKLIKSVIKHLKTQEQKSNMDMKSTNLIPEVSIVLSDIHRDLDNKQISGQLNIFDYVGIA